MLNRVSDLVHAVDRESRVLDAAEARALRNEIEGHLDAAIMARLEMGATPEEAEREAVAAFGDVRRIVRAMHPFEAHRWFDRRFFISVGLGWLSVVAAGFLGAAFFAQFSNLVSWFLVGLSLGLVGLVIRESLRARRAQILPILALFPLFAVLGAVGQATTTLPKSSGEAALDRKSAQIVLAELPLVISSVEKSLAQYDELHNAFAKGAMVAPIRDPRDFTKLSFGSVENRREGAQRWSASGSWKAHMQGAIQSHANDLAWLRKRLEEPWYSAVAGWLGVSTGITSVPMAITLLVNLIVAFVAWLARRIPRRGQTA